MYAFLLSLGGVFTVAGLALGALGVAVQDQAWDTASLTPGIIAVVGGCILIGLALVVRALLRVERALTARPMPLPPMPRPTRPRELEAAAAPAERANEPAHIPFPPKPKNAPVAPAPAAAASSPAAENAPAEHLPEKFPALTQVENAPALQETDVSLLPKAPAPPDEDPAEANHGPAPGRANGTAARTAPRADRNARPARRPERAKGSMFDSLWPRAQAPAAPAAHAAAAAQPAAPPQSAAGGEPAPAAQPGHAPQEAPAPVSILKSGVVEGMAYTLYSDGSIEARLPQGTLRFGSITELRNHIEQSS